MRLKPQQNNSKFKIGLATIIAILLSLIVLKTNHTPVNIAVSINTLDESSTAIIYTQHEDEKANLDYQSKNFENQSFFLFAPYDLNTLDPEKIEISTSVEIPDQTVEFGYLIKTKNKNLKDVFNVQKSFKLEKTINSENAYVYTITKEQLKTINSLSKQQNYVAKLIISLIVFLYFLFILSQLKLEFIKKFTLSIVSFLVYFAIMLMITSFDLELYSLISLFIIIILMILSLFREKIKFNKKIIIGFIYFATLVLSIGKLSLMNQNFYYLYDEDAHIGYIDSLTQNHTVLLPDFKNMHVINDNDGYPYFNHDAKSMILTDANRSGKGENYLGHPPLYYQLMRIVGARDIGNGYTFINYQRMWVTTIAFIVIAMLIYIYIAFTRLKLSIPVHLMIATGLTTQTMMQGTFFGLNNDSLAFLTVAIFSLGAFRFIERKYNFLTYLLICAGISAAVLTKLTAGIAVVVIAILLLIYDIVKHKHLKILIQWQLWLSFFALIPSFIFYIKCYMKYHSFFLSFAGLNPIIYRKHPMFGDVDTRPLLEPFHTLSNMIGTIIKQLLGDGGYSLNIASKKLYTINSFLPNIAWFILFGGAFLAFFLMMQKNIRKSNPYHQLFAFYIISFIVTFVVLINNIFSSSFNVARVAGYQPRYFYNYIPIVLLSFGFFIQMCSDSVKNVVNENYQEKTRSIASSLLILLCIWQLIEQTVIIFIS